MEGQVDHVDLGSGGESVPPRLQLAQAGLSCFQGLGDLLSLGLDARVLSSLVTLSLAALLGLMFPLIPAVLHFGKWAHDMSLGGNFDGPSPWRGGRLDRRGALSIN